MTDVRLTVDTSRTLPHTLIEGDRQSGKSTALIELGGDWQEAGYDLLILVPQAHHVDHLFDTMCGTLYMDRVEVWTYDHVAEGGLRGRDLSNTVIVLEEVGVVRERTLERVLSMYGDRVVARSLTW